MSIQITHAEYSRIYGSVSHRLSPQIGLARLLDSDGEQMAAASLVKSLLSAQSDLIGALHNERPDVARDFASIENGQEDSSSALITRALDKAQEADRIHETLNPTEVVTDLNAILDTLHTTLGMSGTHGERLDAFKDAIRKGLVEADMDVTCDFIGCQDVIFYTRAERNKHFGTVHFPLAA